MLYFGSDAHYNHSNICKGVSTWKDKNGCRDFNTLDEMNSTLVNGINSVVKEDDEFYFLGDFAFSGAGSIIEFRNRIKCKSIHFIYGNHDEHIMHKAELRALFKSYGHYRELQHEKHLIIMNHYPMESFHACKKGAWMLHGHCHGNLRSSYNGKRLDVGVEMNNYKPYSFQELKVIMDAKPIVNLDHH